MASKQALALVCPPTQLVTLTICFAPSPLTPPLSATAQSKGRREEADRVLNKRTLRKRDRDGKQNKSILRRLEKALDYIAKDFGEKRKKNLSFYFPILRESGGVCKLSLKEQGIGSFEILAKEKNLIDCDL